MDLLDYDVARFHPFQVNKKYLRERCAESLGGIYEIGWPFKEHQTSRPARKSHLHDRLAANGAASARPPGGSVRCGLPPKALNRKTSIPFSGPTGTSTPRKNVEQAREGVVIMDISSFGKTMVQGPRCLFVSAMDVRK